MYQDAVKSYQQTNLFTAEPMRLVLMCYDGAISSLKLACEHYKAKNYEAKGRAMRKAVDIIDELNASLDMKKGGEIAANLRALYSYMAQALVDADLKRDLGTIGRIIGMLEELEGEWKAVFAGRSLADVPPPRKGMSQLAGTQPSFGESRAWSV